MKVNGGPWSDQDDIELGDNHIGLVLVDRPNNRVWIYDRVDTPDGVQLDVRESDGRPMDDEKRFVAGEDSKWMVRVVDDAEIIEEVGL
jgi:hypothetical protein